MGQLVAGELFGASLTRSGDQRPRSIRSITPIIAETGDTTMFVVNFDDNRGWMLLNADKESFPVVAYNDTLNFSVPELTLSVSSDERRNTSRRVQPPHSRTDFQPLKAPRYAREVVDRISVQSRKLCRLSGFNI